MFTYKLVDVHFIYVYILNFKLTYLITYLPYVSHWGSLIYYIHITNLSNVLYSYLKPHEHDWTCFGRKSICWCWWYGDGRGKWDANLNYKFVRGVMQFKGSRLRAMIASRVFLGPFYNANVFVAMGETTTNIR